MSIILAVSGSRSENQQSNVWTFLDRLHAERHVSLLIEGACPVGHGGLDELARKWAKARRINSLSVPPKDDLRSSPSAGPRRNYEIAVWLEFLWGTHPKSVGRPVNPVWAFFPGGKGTLSAYRTASRMDFEIVKAPGFELPPGFDQVL